METKPDISAVLGASYNVIQVMVYFKTNPVNGKFIMRNVNYFVLFNSVPLQNRSADRQEGPGIVDNLVVFEVGLRVQRNT